MGVINFFKNTPACRPTPPADTEGLRRCLETDLTTLNNYNGKVQVQLFQGNRFSWHNTFAEKIRNARDASDTRPLETTFRQKGASTRYGAWGWKTGPTSVWKASDQHIFNDRWLMEVQWAHVGNNFVLDFHEDALATVQPRYEITTGVWGRSYQRAGPYIRPVNSLDVTTNYFVPAVWGGDHQIKAGVRWREAPTHSESHWGGNTVARFLNGIAVEADLYRDAVVDYDLQTWAAYAQDTFTRGRMTVNLGVRWDRQRDKALPSEVPAHPFLPQFLPAVRFAGADPGVVWNDVSPRLGSPMTSPGPAGWSRRPRTPATTGNSASAGSPTSSIPSRRRACASRGRT